MFAKIDKLLDRAPCCYLSFTDDGIIQRVNTTLCELTGYSKAELEAKTFEILLSISGKIFTQTHLFPLLKLHNKAEEIFLSLRSKNGDLIPIILSGVRQSENNTNVNNCIILTVIQRRKFEDEILEAKKLAETELKENKELMKARLDIDFQSQELDKNLNNLKLLNLDLLQFNQIINHDMQECIRKIIMFSHLLKCEPNDPHKERVIQSANRLSAINNSLKLFITLGVNNEILEEVNLTDVVKKSIKDVIKKHNVAVDIGIPDLPAIQGFPKQLHMLFIQLFTNSVQFRRGETVKIMLDHSIYKENLYQNLKDKYKYRDVVKIMISDNGIGFDNTFQTYVFSMFKRIEINNQTSMGFGLALCKKIVETHHGNISISSVEGKGTTITIVIPLG